MFSSLHCDTFKAFCFAAETSTRDKDIITDPCHKKKITGIELFFKIAFKRLALNEIEDNGT